MSCVVANENRSFPMIFPNQPRCLIFDLESIPSRGDKPARITLLGALRPDTGEKLELRIGERQQLTEALHRLDALTEGARFVLGHNIIDHDLPLLRQAAPEMALYGLPVIDTLQLSPLAFPQNPYHRLVKDYKLVRDSLNSPLGDCRSTLALFHDQHEAFTKLNGTRPDELLCYQALLAPSMKSGLGSFFASLTGRPPASLAEVRALLPSLLAETDPSLDRNLKVCRTRLHKLLTEELPETPLHWPLAYVLAWLRVSGGNSVLAPWVRYQFPDVDRLLHELRSVPCGQDDCQYCRTTHDPRHELKLYFGFEDFRYEKPDKSLQHDTVLAGMQGQHVLAVLPTGGGKSLCYQLPALNRFHRNASLTVIVSPLQSLMKDQVDGLLERNIHCAATLNGMLTLPERVDVLEGVQIGDVGILLVSPEQFRNNAFRRALRQRQVGAWIFDEAHCLSKWGNDFRPDYLYASRFISEHTRDKPLAPIGCFTATAKPDVLADIESHFRDTLGVEFKRFLGSPERDNLNFEVLPCTAGEKWAVAHRLLEEHLAGESGGAIVFVASRRRAEEAAEFLGRQNWHCRYFHAGLHPNDKKDAQDEFKAGKIQVITATNAFGMGVDKANIRLVVHADIPGSLENYLQEAGRAGRDQAQAHCVMLYDAQDIETQFGLCERSRLQWRDLKQILRKIRNESRRLQGDRLVITAGEILLDDQMNVSFTMDDRDAETKVVTAVAWLDRGDFLSREENQTQVFPARPRLTEEEAIQQMSKEKLPARRREEYLAILRYLYQASADERVNTDQLMALTSMTSEEVAGTLRQMEDRGLLVNDTQMTLYLRHGVQDTSLRRLEACLERERLLFQVLREQAPDADHGGWQDLNLPALTAEMKRVGEMPDLRPDQVLRLLRSLAADSEANKYRHSFDMRQLSHDLLKLRLREDANWHKLEGLGERRRMLAAGLLRFLIDKLPPGARGKDLLVETTFGELRGVIDGDLDLSTRMPPEQRGDAVEHVLLYLHKQEVLALNHGMTVMRRAMTIELDASRAGSYLKSDHARLDEHYSEKRIQVHVIREYAEMALASMAEALRLVLDYFSQPRDAFIRRYFDGREKVLTLATSEESRRTIVEPLNPIQKRVVTDDQDRNRLILAGPGSGKTRVIVHRIAYLLRVRRVQAASVVALAFNRHAANEIRSRLIQLVGADAFGVSILTYHRMAMRLTGTRFDRREQVDNETLEEVMATAVDLLEGNGRIREEEEDDLRARLLRGYRYILVDEYQDINELQYRLVSALAGRHAEEDGRLCILAVGDDDQNIYAWRDTSNRYIKQFQEDYAAETDYLVDNYRSARAIVAAANRVIAENPERMKQEHPIQVDRNRRQEPGGGRWEVLDPERRGKVLRLLMDADDREHGNLQAQACMIELGRLLELEQGAWDGCAVLARTHRYLWPMQAWCEQNHAPYFLAADEDGELPLTRQRGFIHAVEHLRTLESVAVDETRKSLAAVIGDDSDWQSFFATALEQLSGEAGDCTLSGQYIVDWLYDYARELRQQPRQGLYLGTVHSAKGCEFRHVVLLDGDWRSGQSNHADERRLYYVGMTRAQETLTICEFSPGNPFAASLPPETAGQRFHGPPLPELETRYQRLSLRDIDLDYAGRQPESNPIHGALNALQVGDPSQIIAQGERYLIVDGQGQTVGRTARAFRLQLDEEQCRVAGVLVRFAEDSEASYRAKLKCDRWQLAVPLLIGKSKG